MREREREIKGKKCLYFRGAQRKRSHHRRLRKGQKVMREPERYIEREAKMKYSEAQTYFIIFQTQSEMDHPVECLV